MTSKELAQFGETFHKTALAVCSLVLVNDALGGRLVKTLDGEAEGLCSSGCALRIIGDGVLHASAKLGLDGFVAETCPLVLTISFDLALDVCHGLRIIAARATGT